MNEQAATFRALIEQVQLGSHEAAQQLADAYGPHVRRYVHRTLSRELRGQYDSLDFVQLVWASFFHQPEDLPQIDSPEQLIGYLVRMAQHKLLDEKRRLHAQKNDVARERRIDVPEKHITSRDPTPSALAIFREEWDTLVTRQPAEVGRVVQLRYEGATYREIADELQIHERTARKTIDRLERDRSRDDDPILSPDAQSPDAQSPELDEPQPPTPTTP
jgi:RNA polymerase sigma-70 factor (ECF subfamily)